MTVYADSDDFEAYEGIDPETVENIDILLEKASRMIDTYTVNKAASYEDDYDLLKMATCAQVAFWNETGDALDSMSRMSEFALGSFSFSRGSSGVSGGMMLAPRTYEFLMLAGLMYRGVSIS